MVLRLWDYAKTILGSQKLQTSYAKPELGPKKPKIRSKKVLKNYQIGIKINRKFGLNP